MSSKPTSIWHRLYHGETSFRFVDNRRRWFLLSALVIGAGLLSLLTQGLNYGIDFTGGTSWEVKAPGVSVPEARRALRPVGLADARIQVQGSDLLRVQADQRSPEDQTRVSDALARLADVPRAQVSVNDIGPSWGGDVTRKARNALVVFFVLISAYISMRFEWKMAVAALAAVVHDIAVTIGVYSISRFEVTPATVVAFLTILGYSLYDTIVVFDKVEENTRTLSSSGRMTYSAAVDLSMNQVLMRSLNTSLVAILPILSILVIGAGFLGATTLNDFGLALLVGLLTGAYSSIFIAAPILAMLKERESRYSQLRQRVAAKGGGGILTPAAAAAASGSGTSRAGASSPVALDGTDDEPVDAVPASSATSPGTKGRSGASSRPPARPGAKSPQSRNKGSRPRKKGKRR